MIRLILTSVFLSSVSCASLGEKPKAHIIGGSEATIENNPWQVSVQVHGEHICGGAIIAPDTVLTAAHCVDTLAYIGFYEVLAGTSDLENGGLRLSVGDIIINEKYNDYDYDYDIAIVKLQVSLDFTDRVAPAKLPDSEPLAGDNVKVAGWGVLEEGGFELPNNLMEVNVTVVDRKICNTQYENLLEITKSMVCAGSPGGGKDSCQADSGGPLVKGDVLVGIVNFGMGCGEAEFPGVYANVHTYTSWIKENANIQW